ncbi:hypothetical protein ACFL01_04460, partial [Planctomycetota bacterium]
KLIRKSFTFGKRALTIRYERTKTGGSCATSCHVPVKYDRYEPVKNTMKTTPRKGKDATKAELEEGRAGDARATVKESLKEPEKEEGTKK